MLDEKGRFVIDDYQKKKPFASFLPGIAGVKGIPIWSFYVNRGQGICSFGAGDKQNPIMEFFPANISFQIVNQRGFRTFVKVDGKYFEPFSDDAVPAVMKVGVNELVLRQEDPEHGIATDVVYYILPEEKFGALVRCVRITNLKKNPVRLECLDGMPVLIPFGVSLRDMKEVSNLIQSMMQVEHVDERLAYYRLLSSSADSAQVSRIEAGNFYAAFDDSGKFLPVLVDTENIFQYDTQLRKPAAFEHMNLNSLSEERQITSNQLLSAFGCLETTLAPGESCRIHSLIGHAENYEELKRFIGEGLPETWFAEKRRQAAALTAKLGERIHTRTALPLFDAYCVQSYIDNLLRGGYPIELAEEKPFYVYSRKHGDLERDYNAFSMSAEFYSQGNGNYRDVNQNRRSDLLFSPFVRDYNIRRFFSLIQLDGFNPLVLLQSTYSLDTLPEELDNLSLQRKETLEVFLAEPFTPGRLSMFLQEEESELFSAILSHSHENVNAELEDGYWTDHWTYNLDLVESFLQLFPEEEQHLLLLDRSYPYYESRAFVLPRKDRYVRTEGGLRQFRFVDKDRKQGAVHTWARTDYGKGETYYSSLMEKMMLLAVLKFAGLDMRGRGLEMEGGKPGWYDALNGLPGLFGSSLCDSYELARLLLFLKARLETYRPELHLPTELMDLMDAADHAVSACEAGEITRFDVWNRVNRAKEIYREITLNGICGEEKPLDAGKGIRILGDWLRYLKSGIRSAVEENSGIPPAYYLYKIRDYREKEGNILFEELHAVTLPDFLEGPVRYLKLPVAEAERHLLYRKIKESGLYDRKLQMYRINSDLSAISPEIGRARAFRRGWLENESIWLHMEYKYLLELLKSGLYRDYFEDLKSTCIPFLKFDTYGRSLTENSSFLASSALDNEKLHGCGFVARLSGSTAEFLEMWKLMFFGPELFAWDSRETVFNPEPALPGYLIPEDGILEAKLFGTVDIEYRIDGQGDLIPGEYDIAGFRMEYTDGNDIQVQVLHGEHTEQLRNGQIRKVVIQIKRKHVSQ